MSFIIELAVIVVVCLVLGVRQNYIFLGLAALTGVVFTVMLFVLAVFLIELLRSEKRNAVISRVDDSPKLRFTDMRFKTAYYLIDGVEYPNVFPAESMGIDRLNRAFYPKGKQVVVYLNRKHTIVYDKSACISCFAGMLILASGIAVAAFTVIVLLYTLSGSSVIA